MEANELRIGNWILDRDKPVDLRPSQLVNIIERKFKGIYEPITLTEEWLIKFGFKLDEISDEYYSNDEDAILHIEGYLLSPMQETGYCVQLKYVHQLQNLYYALTGEELTLKQ